MNSGYMLSAAKVKQHGMTSAKWTTKDKIIQYKGLISLYTRDKKIVESDVNINRKKQAAELKSLQREIDVNRKKLDNACGGDKQKLRNTLSNHRKLQMAFSKSTPTRVIDMIHQVNFTKRKKRDMLRYRTKCKLDALVDLKLKYALYEDRLKYEGEKTLLPCEKQAHLVTGRVQDAILKKEAAIYIRNSYKEIIAIMKKDAIYFDAVLASLERDGMTQGKCMINATKLGQIGTEYLYDRKEEFEMLTKIVKADLISRRKDLAFMQQNLEMFPYNMKNLIRSDSDINLGKIAIAESKSFTLVQTEILAIETTLKILKEAFVTSSADQIFPCIKEQIRQKKRLAEFVRKCETNRNNLLSKSDQAVLILSELKNTMVATTTSYTSGKAQLQNATKAEEEKAKEYEVLITSRYELLVKIKLALRHLQYLARLLAPDGGKSLGSVISRSALIEPEPDEADCVKIVAELNTKFAKLAFDASTAVPGPQPEEGFQTLEALMRLRSKPVEIKAAVSEDDLMESTSPDALVMSREDVKKLSAEIVVEGLKALEYKPPPTPKKGRFKFKK